MAINLKIELLAVILLSIYVILASIYDYQPFATIMRWNEDINNYWVGSAQKQPPIPPPEDMTVVEFCEKLNIPKERFINLASLQGWQIGNHDDTIANIAKRNGVAPADILNAVNATSGNGRGGGQKNVTFGGRGGWGWKTVQQVCNEYGIDIDIAIQNCAMKNISAYKNSTIRQITDANHLRPLEVVNIVSPQ